MNTETRTKKVADNVLAIMVKVQEGNEDALSAFIELKKMEKAIKVGLDSLKDEAMDEARKHGKGEHAQNGAFFSVAATGGKWKYDHLNDWKNLDDMKKDLEKKYKAAYNAQQSNIMSVSAEDGEIMELPHYVGGGEALKIKLPNPKK